MHFPLRPHLLHNATIQDKEVTATHHNMWGRGELGKLIMV